MTPRGYLIEGARAASAFRHSLASFRMAATQNFSLSCTSMSVIDEWFIC